MATAYEVDQWKDRCRRLTALLDKSRREKEELTRRIRDNSEETKAARAVSDGLAWEVEDLKAQNAKLKELVRCLYDDLKRGPEPPDWIGERRLDMQELGIEVQG